MMSDITSKIDIVKQHLRSYPDFPKPGIVFRDVFGVMSNVEANLALRDLLLAHATEHKSKIQAVCGLESRGFLFGPLIALHLGVPFVPIRKKGKLPGEVIEHSFDMEYGSATLEMQKGALKPNTNVLLVDDLLATGSTLDAGCKLVAQLGSKVHHSLVIIELEGLNGRSKVPSPVHAFIKL